MISNVYSDLYCLTASGEAVAQAIDRYLVEALPLKAEKTQREDSRQAGKLRAIWDGRRLDEVRTCLEIRYSSQSVQHKASHSEVNPSLIRASQPLIAFAEAARVVQPAKGTLDNPTTGQQDKFPSFFGA